MKIPDMTAAAWEEHIHHLMSACFFKQLCREGHIHCLMSALCLTTTTCYKCVSSFMERNGQCQSRASGSAGQHADNFGPFISSATCRREEVSAMHYHLQNAVLRPYMQHTTPYREFQQKNYERANHKRIKRIKRMKRIKPKGLCTSGSIKVLQTKASMHCIHMELPVIVSACPAAKAQEEGSLWYQQTPEKTKQCLMTNTHRFFCCSCSEP